MKRALQLMIVLAASLNAQPKINAGAWQFTILGGNSFWSAQVQIQDGGGAISGTFVSASGTTFPAFAGTVTNGPGGWGTVNITWSSANRDVPGLAQCPASTGPSCANYAGVLAPDGNSMTGGWGGTAFPGGAGFWYASLIPPAAPVGIVSPTVPTLAACTATVQSLTPTTLILSGLQCTVTPTSATSTNVQFTGDTNQVTLTGAYR